MQLNSLLPNFTKSLPLKLFNHWKSQQSGQTLENYQAFLLHEKIRVNLCHCVWVVAIRVTKIRRLTFSYFCEVFYSRGTRLARCLQHNNAQKSHCTFSQLTDNVVNFNTPAPNENSKNRREMCPVFHALNFMFSFYLLPYFVFF